MVIKLSNGMKINLQKDSPWKDAVADFLKK